MPTVAQTAVLLEARRLMDRAMRWLLSNRRAPLDVPTEISRLRPGVRRSCRRSTASSAATSRTRCESHAEEIVKLGIPQEMADWATRIMYGFGLLDVVTVAESTDGT